MDDSEYGPEAPELADVSDPAQKRACDQCRTRKIRCDKESPCSNCRTARRSCSSTGAGQKPKEARQRVLISAQYERKIDQIEDRLSSIEGLLRDLAATRLAPSSHETCSSHSRSLPRPQSTPSVTPANAFSPSRAADTPSTSYDRPEDEDESAFEGNSSLAAHTIFASEFLEHAVSRTSLRDLNPNVSSSLTALQQMVNWQNKASVAHESRFPQQRPMPPGGVRDLPMPPVGVVVAMLRDCKETIKSACSMGIAMLGMHEFKDSCRRVYFPAEEYSLCTFIVVAAGLYYLFCDKAAQKSSNSDKYVEYADLCLDSFETAMAALPLFLPPTDENIMALIFCATRAVELNKPSIVWHMVSTALQMCQILGYHRSSSYASRNAQTLRPKGRTLFWFGYTLERAAALCLGRSSVIQDYDITVPRDVGDMGPAWEPIRMIMNQWIKHAEIQGNIYRKLYSPAALEQPEEQRILAARQLAQEVEDLAAKHREMMKHVDFGDGVAENAVAPADADAEHDGMMMRTTIQADQVTYCSTLTLIYRAIPPAGTFGGTLHLECIETARESIRLHQECMQVLQESSTLASTYLHWTILSCPFIPFVVLFCHIIETAEGGQDLQRLSCFIQSLQGIGTRSDGVEKLQKLCQILHNIATLYVEARQEAQIGVGVGVGAVSLGNEVDMYLNQLGLMPGEMPVDGQFQSVGQDNAATAAGQNFQTAHLGDWISGNQYIMGLLEEENFMNWTGAPQ